MKIFQSRLRYLWSTKYLWAKCYCRNSSTYRWNYSHYFHDLLPFLMNQSVIHFSIKNMQFHSLSLSISTSYAYVPRVIVLDMHDVQKGKNSHWNRGIQLFVVCSWSCSWETILMWVMAEKNNLLHVRWQPSKRREWKTEVHRFHKQHQNKDAYFRMKNLHSLFFILYVQIKDICIS